MIRVEGLRKSFGDVRAVDGVDLHVERGEILVLLGQNGAGKSTTLRCLGGILRPDAGLIELDGLRLPAKLDEVRSRLGVVPDQARLYGRNTAFEYLDRFGYLYGVPEKARRERIAALLQRFELADRSDTVLAAYSRGMAQKVALIRATLHDPDWIFCDEPTAGLDPVAAADMRHYLGEQRARGAALIVTTHVLGEGELMADRIAIMRRGVIVTTGTLDELRMKTTAGRRFAAQLAATPSNSESLEAWLREHSLDHRLEDQRLTYSLPWDTSTRDRAAFAAQLQGRLVQHGAPFHELEEEQYFFGNSGDLQFENHESVSTAVARLCSARNSTYGKGSDSCKLPNGTPRSAILCRVRGCTGNTTAIRSLTSSKDSRIPFKLALSSTLDGRCNVTNAYRSGNPSVLHFLANGSNLTSESIMTLPTR